MYKGVNYTCYLTYIESLKKNRKELATYFNVCFICSLCLYSGFAKPKLNVD